MKRFKTKTIVIAAIVLVVLIAIIVVLFGGKPAAQKKKEDTAPKPALTVTTAQPSQARLPIKMTANGTITAWQEAIIGSESNGLRLTDVRVNVGDTCNLLRRDHPSGCVTGACQCDGGRSECG
jgi:multidrug efflux pump subunit AcrA (membrane-fusion protein)